MGDPLFVRTGRGMVPTAYGRLTRPQVRQLLALIHALPTPKSIPLHDMERTGLLRRMQDGELDLAFMSNGCGPEGLCAPPCPPGALCAWLSGGRPKVRALCPAGVGGK